MLSRFGRVQHCTLSVAMCRASISPSWSLSIGAGSDTVSWPTVEITCPTAADIRYRILHHDDQRLGSCPYARKLQGNRLLYSKLCRLRSSADSATSSTRSHSETGGIVRNKVGLRYLLLASQGNLPEKSYPPPGSAGIQSLCSAR